jgi:hypothetical protein
MSGRSFENGGGMAVVSGSKVNSQYERRVGHVINPKTYTYRVKEGLRPIYDH